MRLQSEADKPNTNKPVLCEILNKLEIQQFMQGHLAHNYFEKSFELSVPKFGQL